jgi:CRP-like cAMP-binding protein
MSTETATDQIVELLERVPFFQGLPRADLEQVARIARPRTLGAGEFLFREGDPGDRLYVVVDGVIEVLKERPLGDHARVALHRQGDAVGEMALLSDVSRPTSVRAVEDSRLLGMTREEFEALLGGETLALRLMRGLARSLRSLDARYAAREHEGEEALRQYGRLVLNGLEPRTAPHADGYRIAGARARDDTLASGSLWDAVSTDDGRTLLALLDAKGQALPSAHLIAVTRAIFHEVGPAAPFDRLLSRVNSAVFRNLFDGLDECVEAAVVEVAGGAVRWSRAGDQPGMVIRADGSTEEAPTHGPPLGILPSFDYPATVLDLAPGDTFLATTEAPEGLVRGAVELVRTRAESDPGQLAQLLQAALRELQARGAETDVSFVVVRKT